jgi:spermidine/putrescine transport system ATP-binding protein
VRIGGADVTHVPAARRPTTTVFQDYALFPHMTVAENVAFGLRMRGIRSRPRRAKAAEMLALVGLAGADAKRPADLSGGQRQRVALARALAVEPEILLLDEPLGALDLGLRRAMQDELKGIQRRVGTTFVHVTHDQEEAMALADWLVVMEAGRIADQGPPERVWRRPATRFAATFLGEINLIPARAAGAGVETPLGLLPVEGPRPDGALLLGLRPEHLGPAVRGPEIGAAEVLETTFQGSRRRARVRPEAAPELSLLAHLPLEAEAAPGSRVTLRADLAHAALIPEDRP